MWRKQVRSFIKNTCPKFFVLVGSASWNTDGTITLGTAEGGRKVVLYVLNDFRIKGMPGYVALRFHQHKNDVPYHRTRVWSYPSPERVLYPQDFKRISVGHYTANWNNEY